MVLHCRTASGFFVLMGPEKGKSMRILYSANLTEQVDRWSYRLRTTGGLALAAASAALLTLSFPPYNLGLLIWIGFIPMLVAQYRILPKRLSSLAPAVAIGGWLGILLIPIFGGKSLFMAIFPLMIGFLAFIMDRRKRLFHERTGFRWFALEGTVGWVGLEMIRGFIPALGTWAFVGYSLWNRPWLLQPLSFFGIYGLDLLIILCNYSLALAIFVVIDMKWPDAWALQPTRSVVKGTLLAFGLVLFGWVGFSMALYTRIPQDLSAIGVAAVQPNLPKAAHRDLQTSAEERLMILSRQTRFAAAKGARLVVWPEMALGFDPKEEYTSDLKALAEETGVTIVIGYVLDRSPGFRNEATVLTPKGEFLGTYGKTHPMVVSGEPKTVTSGNYEVYHTPLGRLATIICFDAHFTDVSRRMGSQGAQLIANPSLFGPQIAALPHTHAVFRAIENRVAFIMADVGFNSAIVDPYGHILELAISPTGEAAILVSRVPLGAGNTMYSRYGDWLGWLSLAGLVFFVFFMSASLRRLNL